MRFFAVVLTWPDSNTLPGVNPLGCARADRKLSRLPSELCFEMVM